MADFNLTTALLGGLLIGLSSTLLLLFNGRIAGISGIVNGAIRLGRDSRWRWLFIAGLLLGGGLYEGAIAPQPTPVSEFAPVSMIAGGLLVGFGTRLGNGCTSGHGVCGLGRLSFRSLVAVLTFLATGFITVFITRHLF
ncbi:YeeE/YedE family protein [Synechococcus sp. PCC 7335]|uniref:YeeE/YedE family protein n=1 Tax=Synechococcus sp. (strain ATCC 29403 / PCC 7335) TaxID=91464 RepID=UPI00017ED9DF|nr:YeeE/YedE thiosulfate transporter family protein [Synechococcus sp. PCC 7335]EDX83024.1 YeeE/YedE family protein [Synechococcus sp. PCC 7335]